jgi:hypothetical protein
VPKTYEVYLDDDLVLTVKDEPGPLMSTALPPPGFVPPTSDFLSAQAHNPFHEHVLRELLEKSSSLEDYLALLRNGGYRVEEVAEADEG